MSLNHNRGYSLVGRSINGARFQLNFGPVGRKFPKMHLFFISESKDLKNGFHSSAGNTQPIFGESQES